MSIIRAYLLPHPPLAVPDVGRGQEKTIAKTLAAFDEAAEEIAALAPETIVFITPHNVIYSDCFHISPGPGARGSLSRFGAGAVRFEVRYDTALAEEIAKQARQSGLAAGPQGERDAALDHGVMVPMWFINRRYRDYRAVRVSQSGLTPSEHKRFGACVARAAEALGRKTVLIASGDLSHKLSEDGPYGLAPEGAVFDGLITDALAAGDFDALSSVTQVLREAAAECGHNSLMVLAGCFEKTGAQTKLLSYECPFGVGYAAASAAPAAGPSRAEPKEDPYIALARASLEHTVKTGDYLPLPDGLPDELTRARAGVFVSLHKHGRLRGCIGTIVPTTSCVAREIIKNAVAAGLQDGRFEPVSAHELPELDCKVDVLTPPEPIGGPEELDVKRYGVIVTCGYRRGLLLPDLDGVDTVAEQVSIARQKGGIRETDPYTLERFEVIRHE
jgi:AmmeMemoRadiSam system protein A